MASSSFKLVFLLFLLSFFHLQNFPTACTARLLKRHVCGFSGIYQLGDSLSDTGNLIQEDPNSVFARLPYGETFSKKPTGRCSNGLLMVDFIALSAGVPFLDAYLNPSSTLANHGHGVNFAVAGSTALPIHVLAQQHILAPVTNSSLNVQLDWMLNYLNKYCYNDKHCVDKLKSALFAVEIGGNDYNYGFFQGKTIEELKTLVPHVVQTIKDAVKRLISYGARRVLVPGNLPIGCLPIYLTGFKTNDTSAYDQFHCLKDLNNFAIYHNEVVQQAIDDLRKEEPHVTIGYGDYYNAYQWTLRHASLLGFDVNSLQKACCGVGGDYNFNLLKMCGAPDVPVCVEPNRYMSWDGVHLTQETYKHIANRLIADMFKQGLCSSYY